MFSLSNLFAACRALFLLVHTPSAKECYALSQFASLGSKTGASSKLGSYKMWGPLQPCLWMWCTSVGPRGQDLQLGSSFAWQTVSMNFCAAPSILPELHPLVIPGALKFVPMATFCQCSNGIFHMGSMYRMKTYHAWILVQKQPAGHVQRREEDEEIVSVLCGADGGII